MRNIFHKLNKLWPNDKYDQKWVRLLVNDNMIHPLWLEITESDILAMNNLRSFKVDQNSIISILNKFNSHNVRNKKYGKITCKEILVYVKV